MKYTRTKQLLLVSIFCLITFFINSAALAQIVPASATSGEIDAANALKSYQHGIDLMKKQNYKGAIESFNDAVDLDSSKPTYQYQLGLAHFYAKNYSTTIAVMKGLIKKFAPGEDRYYQIMGQSYQEIRKPRKAYAVFLEGLKKFPKSGGLNNELGKIEYRHKNMNLALQYWENGIAANPEYPSNYYNAAKAYSRTDEKIWAIIYGEIFMNLEVTSGRTYEISRIIYECYEQSIYIKNAKNKYVFFSSIPLNLTESEQRDTTILHNNLEFAYSAIGRRCLSEFKTDFNIINLIMFRKKFIDVWYQKNYPLDYAMSILAYHRTLLSNEHFEAYNYWLLSRGNEEAFNEWFAKNKSKYDKFLKFMNENPLDMSNLKQMNRLDARKKATNNKFVY
jgi:tetratricopeptide (TPR) repeat protein